MTLYDFDGHDAKALANTFLGFATAEARAVTNMQLQKLLYNAHGYHLAMFDKPLFWQPVQAWKYGPVIADVYRMFRHHGAGPIESLAVRYDEKRGEEVPYHAKLSSQTLDFLRKIWNGHKNVDPVVLSKISHRPGTPWSIVTIGQDLGVHQGIPIPNSVIQSYFAKYVEPTELVTIES